MLDLQKIRQDFPILARKVNGKDMVYLDSAATSQKPRRVIEAEARFYETSNANIHRGAYGLGSEATNLYEGVREQVARFVGASGPEEIVFTRNTTESINLVAQSWGRQALQPGDEILISEAEHHANWVPWAMIAAERGARLRQIPLGKDGRLDLEAAKGMMGPKLKMLALSWASNVLGLLNPVEELTKLAKAQGALVLLDAAQAAPHLALRLASRGADFAAFSAHKMLGPTGVGVLWGRKEVLESLPPYQGGGSMIERVSVEGISYQKAPWRFEAGTPNIAGVVAFGAALDYLEGLGWEAMQAHEERLNAAALEMLLGIEGLQLYGEATTRERLSVFSFNMEGINAQDVGALLDSMGLELRVGNHCAQPLMSRLNCAGTVRASFYLYNTLEEVQRLGSALGRVQAMLGKAHAAS